MVAVEASAKSAHKRLDELSEEVKAVSYTHLDINVLPWTPDKIVFKSGGIKYIPVSYTHLDVYKRQFLRCSHFWFVKETVLLII